MKAAAKESFGYNEDEIVSSDIVGMRFGSFFDATQTMVCKVDDDSYEVQVVSWYDNENCYTSQMVRTIKYFSRVSISLDLGQEQYIFEIQGRIQERVRLFRSGIFILFSSK